MEANEDREHAAFHKSYHKSELHFHGLRTPLMRRLTREHAPRKLPLSHSELIDLANTLWQGEVFEERVAALQILCDRAHMLTPKDLPWLEQLCRESLGWGLLDTIGVHLLGPLALEHGKPVYAAMQRWSRDAESFWVRRASVLVHILPARKQQLEIKLAWNTMQRLLPEKEFFIRKAIGWTLRECVKHYESDVLDFVSEYRDSMSGLTFREATRKMSPKSRKQL